MRLNTEKLGKLRDRTQMTDDELKALNRALEALARGRGPGWLWGWVVWLVESLGH
jgi:hypothetical protein